MSGQPATDAGKGGKYLFLPPAYAGSRPEGHIVVPSPTVFVHAAIPPDHSRTRHARRRRCLQSDAESLPARRGGKSPQTKYIDAYPKPWKTLPVYDLTFFRDLAGVINDEPAAERDAVVLSLLASIGIEKGKPFNPTDDHARVFEQAIEEAYATMQDYFTTPGKALVPHWPDRHWMASRHTEKQGFTFMVDGRLLVDERAGGFALWATWLPKKLGAASAYPTALRDGAANSSRVRTTTGFGFRPTRPRAISGRSSSTA